MRPDPSAGLLDGGARIGLLHADGGAALFGIGGMQPLADGRALRGARHMNRNGFEREFDDVPVRNSGGEQWKSEEQCPEAGHLGLVYQGGGA